MCISLLDNAIISPLLYNAIVFYIFFNFSILHNLYGVLLCIMHNRIILQGYVVYIIPRVYFWDLSRTFVRFVLSCTFPRPKVLSDFYSPRPKIFSDFPSRQLKIGKTFPLPQLTISKFILLGARTNLVFVLLSVVLHHYHQFHTNLLFYS